MRVVPRSVATLALAVALTACGGDPAPGPARPGDTLFEHLDRATVARHPETNLDSAVAEVARAALAAGDGTLSLLTPPLAWTPGRTLGDPSTPAAYLALFEGDASLRLWRSQPDIRPADDAPDPVPIRGGRPVPAWIHASGEPFPGELLHWLPEERTLRAISRDAPTDLRLLYETAVEPEFGDLEPGLFGRAATTPADLVRRARLKGMSRRALLLPAPAALEVSLGPLRAERLAVSVGAFARSWRPVVLADGRTVVARDDARGDGLVFRVEVDDGTGFREAWRAALAPGDAGRRWLDDAVDLTPWAGRPVTLRLSTDPGPAGDAVGDYGLWGDLRLRGGPARAPDRPHVLLLDIDTLRADRLSLYGHHRETTPRLDAWAAREALVFDDARTVGSFTLPTTASILTGLAPHQHLVDHFPRALTPAAGPIALVLGAHGYETRAIAEGAYLAPSFGFDTGFDAYATRPYKRPDWSEAVDWIRERDSDRPLFLFLQTYLVHAPYDGDQRFVDPAYDGPLRGRVFTSEMIEAFHRGELPLDDADRAYVDAVYDALVADMDDLVVDFLEAALPLLGDETLVILTADHGEAFFEHGLIAHGHGLYDELLAVPLLVRPPGSRGATADRAGPVAGGGTAGAAGSGPARIGTPVSVLDIVPTILDVVGLQAPPHLPGRSLLGPAGDDRPQVSRFSDTTGAIVHRGWKLVDGPIMTPAGPAPDLQLFELGADPAEQRNLADDPAQAELLERLRGMRADWEARWPAPAGAGTDSDVSDGDLEDLRALGYLGEQPRR